MRLSCRLADGSLTPAFPKTPQKCPLFSKATPISSNDCKGLMGQKCKRTNVYRSPVGLTGCGGYIPPHTPLRSFSCSLNLNLLLLSTPAVTACSCPGQDWFD